MAPYTNKVSKVQLHVRKLIWQLALAGVVLALFIFWVWANVLYGDLDQRYRNSYTGECLLVKPAISRKEEMPFTGDVRALQEGGISSAGEAAVDWPAAHRERLLAQHAEVETAMYAPSGASLRRREGKPSRRRGPPTPHTSAPTIGAAAMAAVGGSGVLVARRTGTGGGGKESMEPDARRVQSQVLDPNQVAMGLSGNKDVLQEAGN